MISGVLRAIDDAESEHGISAGLLVSAHRHRSEADAFALLESVLPWAGRIAGWGLGGAEVGNPPAKFRGYFAELHRLGFRTTAHAGEEGPADYVRQAVELLGVDRIDHGLSVLDDADLVADVAAARTPLTVCPVSNLRLKVVRTLRDHPLPALLATGLNVTISSDDPSYFGAYVADNYLQCAEAFGLTDADLARLAANSLAAASAEPAAQHCSALVELGQVEVLVAGVGEVGVARPPVERRHPERGEPRGVGPAELRPRLTPHCGHEVLDQQAIEPRTRTLGQVGEQAARTGRAPRGRGPAPRRRTGRARTGS